MDVGRDCEKNTYATFRKWLNSSYEGGIVSPDDKEAAITYFDERVSHDQWQDERPALDDDETQIGDVEE